MARPKKEIRAQLTSSGRFRVAYVENPGAWFMTPETVEAKALAWARRNRDHLIGDGARAICIRNLASGFFDLSGEWRTRMAAKGQSMSDRHLSNMAAIMENHLLPMFGDDDPRKLSARDIDDRILAARGINDRELAPGTKYKIVHVFRVFLGDLAERGIIDRNPLIGLQPYSKKPVRARGALPREVFAALFPPTHGEAVQVWGRSLWAALMCVLGDTGMRPGEARRLTWTRIYEDEAAVVIRHAEKAGNSGKGDTKTGAVRAGRLSPRTLQELAIWRMESRFSGDDDLIFTLDGREPVTDAAIGQAFRRGLRAIGVSTEKGQPGAAWTPYWLRHTFVTYSLAHLTIAEVALLAGHSEAIARGVYAHPDDEVVLKQLKGIWNR